MSNWEQCVLVKLLVVLLPTARSVVAMTGSDLWCLTQQLLVTQDVSICYGMSWAMDRKDRLYLDMELGYPTPQAGNVYYSGMDMRSSICCYRAGTEARLNLPSYL